MSYAGGGRGGRGGQDQEVRSKEGRTEKELLQNTLKTLTETDEISTKTLDTLGHQDEQIQRIKEDTTAIDHNLDQSEKLLKVLGPFGWVRAIFSKDKGPAGGRGGAAGSQGYPSQGSQDSSRVARGAARLQQDAAARQAAAAPKAAAKPVSKEDEIDKMYDQMDGILDGLKSKSHEINRTLERHNEQLPEITSAITRQQDRIDKQSKDMQKRMR